MRRSGKITSSVLSSLIANGEGRDDHRRAGSACRRRHPRAGRGPTFKGYHGYTASICASVNDEVVHGIPGSTSSRTAICSQSTSAPPSKASSAIRP